MQDGSYLCIIILNNSIFMYKKVLKKLCFSLFFTVHSSVHHHSSVCIALSKQFLGFCKKSYKNNEKD